MSGHCGGIRFHGGRFEEVHGGACRSSHGLCACACSPCVKAQTCKHERTYSSFGSITPIVPGIMFEADTGRAKRADGTDYVGPIMRVRRCRPDEPVPKARSWKAEVCLTCGMLVRETEGEL